MMKKRILLSLSVVSLALLHACGGGGSSGKDAAPAVSANTGSVTAKFVPKESKRFMVFSTDSQSVYRGESEQEESGAMVRLGPAALTGGRHTVDIAGDAHFALGRWVKGTLTRSTDTVTLKGNDDESYHYLAYNGLSQMPASGEFQCKTVAVTAPTAHSSTRASVGTASGSAHISFDASGAAIQGTMQVHTGAESATLELSTTIENPGSVTFTGGLLARGPGAAITLADQGNAAPGLVVAYKTQLPGGNLYTGVARFACTPP